MGTVPEGLGLLILTVILVVLTGLSVLARFVVRAQSKAPFAADDWWVLASVTFFYGSAGPTIWYLAKSPFLHSPLPPVFPKQALQIMYAAAPLFVTTIATAKISVLCLYRRIFPVQSFRRYSLIVGIGVVILWLICVPGNLFICTPVQAYWEERSPNTCINGAAFFLALELFNCLLDIVMLSLPIRMVRGLQMPLRQKIAVATVFLLGGLVLVAGILRMALSYRAGSASLTIFPNMASSFLENGLAIICACFPTYGPILSRSGAMFSNTMRSCHSLINNIRGKGRPTSKQIAEPDKSITGGRWDRNSYQRINSGTSANMIRTNISEPPSTTRHSSVQEGYALDTINGAKTTDIV